MNFCIYNQQEILSNIQLTNYLIDTIIENLSYIYGNDMESEENRNAWIDNTLRTEDATWRVIIANQNAVNIGFIVYSVKSRSLSVNEIEIDKEHRLNPALISGLFCTLFKNESKNFDTISGYINKKNKVSQHNFLKLATTITERPNGYSFIIDKPATDKIKAKIKRWER